MEKNYTILIIIVLLIIGLILINRYKTTSLTNCSTNTCTLDDLLLNCKSGDLILYQDHSKAFWHLLYDQSQRLILGHAYTHCGMVLKYDKEAYIIESIPPGHSQSLHRDLFTGTYGITGVKTIPLSVACHSYPGGVVWYPLNKEVNSILLKNMARLLSDLKYPAIFDMLSDIFGAILKYAKIRELKRQFIKEKETRHHLFCSELLAFLYRALGVFHYDGLSCHYWLPSDFVKTDLPFVDGYKFSDSFLVLMEH